MKNPYLLDASEYERDIDVIAAYKRMAAIYLSKQTETTLERATVWAERELGPGGKFEIKPPKVTFNIRDPKTGDKRRAESTLDKLLSKVSKNKLIMAPSMTVYLPPSLKKSLISEFIDENIRLRGVAKSLMFQAEARGDHQAANNYDNDQASKKTRNNGLSGAHVSKFNILHNPSMHSTLTSFCRTATAYGNSNNEKLLGSSRHYYLPSVVIDNILATIDLTDMVEFDRVLKHFGIVYPTVKDTMACIRLSSNKYIRNEMAIEKIRLFVEKLDPVERAAFVYIGDLRQVALLNRGFMINFLDSFLVDNTTYEVDYEEIEKTLNGDVISLVSLLRNDLTTGTNVKELKKNNIEQYHDYLRTVNVVNHSSNYYFDFIRAFLTTKVTPLSISDVPDIVRTVAMTSDTDSTMGMVQWWCEWYTGKPNVAGKIADDLADIMVYVANQNLAHYMATMSCQTGVPKEQLFRYQMKNEFKFKSFSLTNKAKHYFSLICSREGNIYSDPELELKGVALRTSNIPISIMTEFRAFIKTMMLTVQEGELIEIIPILRRIAEIENNIVKDTVAGHVTYLKTGQIKPAANYTKPHSSAYVYHDLWESCFSKYYGSPGEPTYDVVKISTLLTTKSSVKQWIDGIENKPLQEDLRRWFAARPGRTLKTILLSDMITSANGIPKEIAAVIDFRRIIFTSMEPYYHVLESMGLPFISKNRDLLVCDLAATDLSSFI